MWNMEIYANARIYAMARESFGGLPESLKGRGTDAISAVAKEALVVDGARIAFVGSLSEARDFAETGTKEIDCGGGVLLPGLVDSHIHALATAASRFEVDLRSTRSLAEAVHRIAEHARYLPDGQWVTGGRWDANTWTDVHEPNRQLLDELVPERPVAVWSIDFHTLWLNGAALASIGIDDDTPDPRGGRIVRDGNGAATGVLKEDAATLAERQFPVAELEVRVEQLRQAQQAWLAEGITGVHDFDGGAARQAWRGLNKAGDLRLKVVKYLRLDEWDDPAVNDWRTGTREGTRFLQGGLKLFSDGALGSHTCHMTHPFPQVGSDGQPNYGLPIASEDVLAEQIIGAYDRGIGVAIHAIGDKANRTVLRAFERTAQQRQHAIGVSGHPLRPRLEHAQFVQACDVSRMAQLGAIASMQPRHCISDIPLLPQVEGHPGLLAYPWGELASAGVALAFGSDAPVEPTNPFVGVYAAMTRATIDGDASTSFQPERRISAYDAIRAHTSGAAYAAGLEEETGQLAPGMDADFIVVDSDPLVPKLGGGSGVTGSYESEDALFQHACAVRDTAVQMTVAGGKEVHTI